MKKIIFTGPESTGKTTICRAMAEYFNCSWVPEYAREYLEQLNRPYTENDLFVIAKGQWEREEQQLDHHGSFLFCDTSMLVLKIWSVHKYGKCHPWISRKLEQEKPARYFLCAPDIPWEYDSLREHPLVRNQLFELYEIELKKLGVAYHILRGKETERNAEVVKILRSL